MDRLVECVPNFSEGRDRAVIDGFAAAIADAGGRVLSVEPDAAYHRVVITFVAAPEVAGRAAVAAVRRAEATIDMRKHHGGHPRIGAADVVPFVPLRGVTMADCARLAREVGRAIGALGLPVYLYGEAATRPERRDLPHVRRGEYEGLAARLATAEGLPDFGPAEFVPGFGAVCVGARPFLIAYNVDLAGADLALAREVAARVRESGRVVGGRRVPGLLTSVKAIGVELAGRGTVQVSVNLTDPRATPLQIVHETIDREARALGSRADGSEIVGLVPLFAVADAGAHFARLAGEDPATLGPIDLVARADRGLGLSRRAPFDARAKVLDFLLGTLGGDA
jgi:glutamate formiminotransferase